MAPLDIIFITRITHHYDSTNPGKLVFEAAPDLFDYCGPIKNYIVDTNRGLMVDAGALQLAGVSTQFLPVAGYVGRARLYLVGNPEVFEVLSQIVNDTYYANTKNARSQRELEVRQIRQFIATRILNLATS
jgi:hypothetical protein